MKFNIRKILEFLCLISGIFGVLSYYIISIEVSRIFFITFLVLIGIYIFVRVLKLVRDVRENDFEYFKNVIIGITGGFIVFFLTKIDFSSAKDMWFSLASNLQLITIALFIIFVGYLISRKHFPIKSRL